jgi:predicted acyl esterase
VPDADLQATITEVRPDGMEEYVGRGWLRLSQRALDPGRSTSLLPYLTFTRATTAAMPIGQAEPVRLELQQFSHVFRAGSSIRVWIDSPSETGEWSFSSPTNQGTIQVLHDPAHPSRLVLGLLQQGGISSGFPACDTVLSEPCRINPVPVPR